MAADETETAFERGEHAGRNWALGTADFDSLDELDAFLPPDACDDRYEWESFFQSLPGDTGVAQSLQSSIQLSDRTFEQFWRDECSELDSLLDESEFLRGFSSGALSIWRSQSGRYAMMASAEGKLAMFRARLRRKESLQKTIRRVREFVAGRLERLSRIGEELDSAGDIERTRLTQERLRIAAEFNRSQLLIKRIERARIELEDWIKRQTE